jgi:hypothetical protein
MIDYRTPPLGYLVRVPQESLDSSLDESARSRAEDAARFLSFEWIGNIATSTRTAMVETAEIIHAAMGTEGSWDLGEYVDPEVVCSYMRYGGPPCILVLSDKDIQASIASMTGADVCGEIVAPGGIISIHRQDDTLIARARHMVLDFSFTDFVEAASAGS